MSTLSPRPLLPTFIPSLNALLAALSLPFTLDHPADLTPSLLLAIFESIIGARLPIPNSVRQSRTRDAKSRAMLVLLGVLECDVLRGGTAAADADGDLSVAASNANDSALSAAGGVSVDGWVDEIGLGQVDPERLADGGWEETIFVGELLCWLARRRGILPRIRSSRLSSRPRSLYLNHHSYGTEEGEGDGDTVDLSNSLLLRPSSAQKSRSHQVQSPPPSIVEASVDADFSTFSHISNIPRHPLVHSPEPSLSVSATTHTDLSIRARSISSRTSVSNTHNDLDDFDGASQDTLQLYNAVRMMQDAEEDDDQPPSFRPQCIHELEDPSYIRALAGPSSSFGHSASHESDSEEDVNTSRDECDDADGQDNDDLYAPPTPTPRRVRLTGWIDPVDSATELNCFVASRTRSRAFPTSGGSGARPPSQSHSSRHDQTDQSSKSTTSRLGANVSPRSRLERLGRFNASHHASPSPSPSPPLFVPSPNHLARRSPPSPPSPHTHSDPPFDISFSKPNNTSTPAKPRPPRRPQFQTGACQELESELHLGVDVGKSGGGSGRAATRPLSHRSPIYTSSTPSFSTRGNQRSGGSSGINGGTRAGSSTSSGTKQRLGISASSASSVQSSAMSAAAVNGKRWSVGTPTTVPPLPGAKGKSPPSVPLPGSTATTSTLLTERARLLTELAALKRVRAAASGAGVGRAGSGVGNGDGIVGHRVGVGV